MNSFNGYLFGIRSIVLLFIYLFCRCTDYLYKQQIRLYNNASENWYVINTSDSQDVFFDINSSGQTYSLLSGIRSTPVP